MKMWNYILGALLAVALGAPVMAQEEAAPTASGGRDTVRKVTGEQMIGVNVTSETYETVTVDGKPIPAAEIDTITHFDQPPKYIQAMSNFKQYQLENAIKNFEEAKATPGARPWLKHYCDYYIARCYQAQAEAAPPADRAKFVSGAVSRFEALIKETPKGYWVPSAMSSLGQCYYSMGDFPKALAVYQQIEKANMGAAWVLRAQLWQGKILTAQRQADAAIAALTKVAETAKEKHADVYNEAEIALAEAYIVGQKFKDAETLLKGLVEDANQKEEIKAAAHNTLGDCYMAQNKVKEARWEYLRTNVLYSKVKDQDARALFSAANCFEMLKDKANADKLRDELKRSYPDSPWARALAGG